MAGRKTTKLQPKRVVYLWGAGATHAEAQHVGAPVNLLMRDDDDYGPGLTARILKRAGKSSIAFRGSSGSDIEKLISLLTTSGVSKYISLAEDLRRSYFTEIRESLAKANLLGIPRLATRLLEFHQDPQFSSEVEILSGIITTNHDGLLQIASQHVFSRVNSGFRFESNDFAHDEGAESPILLQLHGSFTWQFGSPIQMGKLRRTSKYDDAVWLPPTILKESKAYPFNKLTGMAHELLCRQCDVLRVVGSSLTQNDWNILSLIFNAQRYKELVQGEAFLIELIMPHAIGEGVKRECSYLKNVNPIGYLTEGKFAIYKDDPSSVTPESDYANPFFYWLSQKIDYHAGRSEIQKVNALRL